MKPSNYWCLNRFMTPQSLLIRLNDLIIRWLYNNTLNNVIGLMIRLNKKLRQSTEIVFINNNLHLYNNNIQHEAPVHIAQLKK